MPPLSWSLQKLSLTNFRLYGDFEVDFEDDLTVLVGRNGSGKTAILDALSIALGTLLTSFHDKRSGNSKKQKTPGISKTDAHKVAHSQPETRISDSNDYYPVSIKVNAILDNVEFSWDRTLGSESGRTTWGDREVREHIAEIATKALEADGQSTALPIIAYYGIERLVAVQKVTSIMGKSRLSAYENSLVPKSDTGRLTYYIRKLTETAFMDHARTGTTVSMAFKQLEAIRSACDMSIGDTGWSAMDWDPFLEEVTFYSDNANIRLPLSSLSSGIRITAGLVLDIASRMARANPTLGGEQLLKDTPGIILIDEVDLHLHPTWQQTIVDRLRRAFPRVQFIISTHSPQVLSSVEASSIRILEENGVRKPEYAEGLRSDIVLRYIQETSPTPETANRKTLNDYLKLVHNNNQGKSPEAKALRDELDAAMGGAQMVPELAEADAYMFFVDEL